MHCGLGVISFGICSGFGFGIAGSIIGFFAACAEDEEWNQSKDKEFFHDKSLVGAILLSYHKPDRRAVT